MERDGKLRLELVDVYGKLLNESVDILLRSQTVADDLVVRGVNAGKRIVISNLRPSTVYRVEVDAPSYFPVSFFVGLKGGTLTERRIQLPVNPKKVVDVSFPKFPDLSQEMQRILKQSRRVESLEAHSGEGLYEVLDPLRRASLLNVLTKCAHTRIGSESTVLSCVKSLRKIEAHFLRADVDAQLRDQLRKGVLEQLFEPADSALHFTPPGLTQAGSFKTVDGFGNLQITFFTKARDWTADLDIDDARGLEHAFHVLREALTLAAVHPYVIHEILILHQQLDPGYILRT